VILSSVLYCGIALALLGALSLVRPPRALRIRRRRTALLILVAGTTVAMAAALSPSGLARDRARPSAGGRLDTLMPEYDFSEHHEAVIPAPAERVYQAVKEVRPGEIRLLTLLMGLRTLRPGRMIGRDVPPLASQPPMLKVSEDGGFVLLAEDAGREIVQGTCAQFWRLGDRGPCPGVDSPQAFLAFREPGYAKAAISFRVIPLTSGSRVTTETRILATDAGARRRFGAYWRVIYPGSALIRIGWLDAIRRRAETPGAGGP
jgi:hypothetical protein